MAKPEFEFFPATTIGWTKVAGADVGMTERILAKDDSANVATRILNFPAGCDTTPNGVQVHDFWEEVYILEGSFHDIELNQTFHAGEYACRPPGMKHGPWTSEAGCVTFEVRYYSSKG
jgi:quercetin dioxygenase-like cupin family protein